MPCIVRDKWSPVSIGFILQWWVGARGGVHGCWRHLLPCIVRNKWCPVSIWQFLRWRHFAACAMQRRQLGIQWFCHVHAVPRQHLSIDGRCYIPVVVSSVSHGYRKFNRVFVMSSGAWRIQVCVRARCRICVVHRDGAERFARAQRTIELFFRWHHCGLRERRCCRRGRYSRVRVVEAPRRAAGKVS